MKQVEKKWKDGLVNITNLVSGTPQYLSVTDIDQGTTSSTRIGDEITLKSLTFRIRFHLLDSETIGGLIRWMLIYDRRPLGAQATLTQVLNVGNSTTAIMNMNPQYRGRFQILHDSMLQLNVSGKQFGSSKGYIPLRNLKCKYNATGGGVSDQQTGNLFIAVVSNGNDANLQINGYLRIRFTDE
jgi:hypothetical protein